jgi:hypothetical protein
MQFVSQSQCWFLGMFNVPQRKKGDPSVQMDHRGEQVLIELETLQALPLKQPCGS